MLLLHAETDRDGNLFFRAEKCHAGDGTGDFLAGDGLLSAVGEVVCQPDGFAPIEPDRPDRVQPFWDNLLMFLSDVRGRRFRPGVFIAADMLGCVDEFHVAARVVADGHCLPSLEKRNGAFVAVWRPLAQGSPFRVPRGRTKAMAARASSDSLTAVSSGRKKVRNHRLI